MHNCRKIRKKLHELALGQLDSDTAQQIEQHLTECEECRRIFDAEKLYCENIGAVADALSTLPQDKNLSQAVTEVIEQEKENPPVYISRRHFPVATAAALVVVMLVAIFAGRMGLMENTGLTADTAQVVSDDMANGEQVNASARLYSAVTQDDAPQAVNAPVELYDEIETTSETDGATEQTKDAQPILMMSAAPPAPISEESQPEDNSLLTDSAYDIVTDDMAEQVLSTDTETVEPDESDPALEVHKTVAEYNDFINSEALILLYPQIIMHDDDSEFYYDNFVRNNCGGPLIENTNFYCLHLTFDQLKNALDLCGITDYTVIQPDDPTRTDMVYIYYK